MVRKSLVGGKGEGLIGGGYSLSKILAKKKLLFFRNGVVGVLVELVRVELGRGGVDVRLIVLAS